MAKKTDLHITGEAVIRKNTRWGYPVYSVKLSNQFDGEWQYMDMQVQFPKGTELDDETRIKFNDAFFSFYTNKDNEKIVKIIVTSFDIMNQVAGTIDIPSLNSEQSDLPW